MENSNMQSAVSEITRQLNDIIKINSHRRTVLELTQDRLHEEREDNRKLEKELENKTAIIEELKHKLMVANNKLELAEKEAQRPIF